jgi:hypothetical protein
LGCRSWNVAKRVVGQADELTIAFVANHKPGKGEKSDRQPTIGACAKRPVASDSADAHVAICETGDALAVETCIRRRAGIAVGASVLRDELRRPGFGGEVDFDSEAAAGSGVWGDGGVVGVGDRLHDRKAKPDPVGSEARVGAESLERFEEAGELAGRN